MGESKTQAGAREREGEAERDRPDDICGATALKQTVKQSKGRNASLL